ncbi:two-component system, OmpR family, sensor histidine kinase CiaH [Pilibacter termitis]|uniref:histidine kinase n=1 Tax=Pilibacter termitis TaxID=263852 RepID=A0A1T4N520_9ENTE|nr:HAMP domain-containing sensor histidine kinase [Pilibacter termitis]SJZ74332.1 two-component system, OmpR family, sensor histidine kinase CiaH [Pilibacter termitis]
MHADLSKKQLQRFFIQNVFAFALVFSLLGLIVINVMHQSAYMDVDEQLQRIAKMSFSLQSDGTRLMIVPEDKPEVNQENQGKPKRLGSIGFQSQIILWSKDKEQVASTMNNLELGNLSNQIKFSSLNKGSIQEVSSMNAYGEKIYFHSILTEFKGDERTGIAYIQVLSNTNQVRESVSHFEKIIVWCMVIFWLLSLILSFYLARISMRPLLSAWSKQQEFVENASHELRTPLAIIQNKLETLFTKPDESILEHSEEIADSLGEIRRLRNLTSDLLLLARRDGTQVQVNKEEVEISKLTKKITDDYAELAKLDEKVLRYEFDENGSDHFWLDKKLYQQLMVILLDNAIKYTNTGDEIVVSTHITKSELELVVKDTGIGMTDEVKRKIFERFVRADASRNKQTGGFGLGLSIAKQMMEQLGGKIMVLDNLPKGSVFKISFPK